MTGCRYLQPVRTITARGSEQCPETGPARYTMQDLRRSQSSNATLGANEGHRGDDQPAVVYDGSPMHDYLASVAPEELPSSSIMPAGQSFAAPRRTSSASEASEAPNSSDDRAGQLGTPPRRKVGFTRACHIL